MSRSIEERVVQMEFENESFEKKAAQTTKTLEQLDEKLQFKNGTKSFQDVEEAAKKTNFQTLINAAEKVTQKFSIMGTIGTAALTNIANKAVNAGETLLKSLTIDQITAGWNKMDEITKSTGTLVAQGYELAEVDSQLAKLNWFTDETSYNLTDMVSNISKFTATGRGLEDSTVAMEGIALWAALSGQNATTASRAMYQLSQALGAGYMRLEDYRSIQNASMDTDEFRQKSIEAAIALGQLQDNLNGTYTTLNGTEKTFTKSQFAQSLTEGMWFTSDVMMEVFKTYSSGVDQIYDYAQEHGLTASESIEQLEGSVDEFGLKAFRAGQEARTFGDAIDSIKDATSTKWAGIFKSIFGDYDQQRSLWTQLANDMYTVFVNPIDEINSLFSDALAFDTFSDKIRNAEVEYGTFRDIVAQTAAEHGMATDSMISDAESFEELLSADWFTGDLFAEAIGTYSENIRSAQEKIDILLTDFASGEISDTNTLIEKINGASIEYDKFRDIMAQTASEYGIATDSMISDATSFEELLSAEWITGDLFAETITRYSESFEEEKEALAGLAEEAKNAGDAFREMATKQAGNELLADAFSNAISGVVERIELFREVWSEIFPPATTEQIYAIAEKIKSLGEAFRLTEEKTERLKNIFTGIIRPISYAVGVVKEFVNAFSPLTKIADYVGKDLSKAFESLMIKMGDIFSNDSYKSFFSELKSIVDAASDVFIEFIELIKRFGSYVSKYIPDLSKVFEPISRFFSGIKGKFGGIDDVLKNFKNTLSGLGEEDFANAINYITTLASKISPAFESVKNKLGEYADRIADFFAPLTPVVSKLTKKLSGFGTTISNKVIKPIRNFFSNIRSGNSPLTTFVDNIQSVIASIKNFGSKVSGIISKIDFSKWKETTDNIFNDVSTVVSDFIKLIKDSVGDLSFDDILIGATSIVGLIAVSKISEATKKIGDLAGAIKTSVNNVNQIFKATQTSNIVRNIRVLAESIAIVAASLFALAFVPVENLKKAGIAVAGIAVALTGLSVAMAFISKKLKPDNLAALTALSGYLKTLANAILKVSLAMLIIGKSGLTSQNSWAPTLQAVVLLVGTIVAIAGLMIAMSAVKGPLMTGAIALGVATACILLIMNNLTKIRDALNMLGITGNMTEKLYAIVGIMLVIGVVFAIIGKVLQGKGLKIVTNNINQMSWAVGLLAIIASLYLVLMAMEKLKSVSVAGLGDKVVEIIVAIGVVLGAITLLSVIGRYLKFDKTIAFLGVGLVGLLGAMYLVLLMIEKVAQDKFIENTKKATSIVGGISVIVAVLAIAIAFAGKLSGGGKGMLSIVVAVAGLVAVMGMIVILSRLMKNISWSDVSQQLLILVAIAAGLSGVMIAMGFAAKLGGAKGIVYVIGVLGAIIALATVLVLLRKYTAEQLAPACNALLAIAAALGVILICLGICTALMGKNNIKWSTILLSVLMLGAIAGAIYVLSGYSWGELGGAVVAMIVTLAALTAAMYLISKMDVKLSKIVAMGVLAVVVAAVIAILCSAMAPLASLDSGTLLKNAGILLLTFVLLGGALLLGGSIISNAWPVAAGIGILVAALLFLSATVGVFAAAMTVMDSCNLAKIGSDLLIVAQGLGTVTGYSVMMIVAGLGALILAAGIAALAGAAKLGAGAVDSVATAIQHVFEVINAAAQTSFGQWLLDKLGIELPAAAEGATAALEKVATVARTVTGIFTPAMTTGVQTQEESVTGTIEQLSGDVEETITSSTEDVKAVSEDLGGSIPEGITSGITNGLSDLDIGGMITEKLGEMNLLGEDGSFDISSLLGGENFDISSMFGDIDMSSMSGGLTESLSGAISGVDISSMFGSNFSSIDWTSTTSSINTETLSESLTETFSTIDMTSAGTEIATSLVDGITTSMGTSDKVYKLIQAGIAAAGRIKTGFKAISFYSCGAHVCDGIVQGINANAGKVMAAAQALAQQAAATINAALQINSPSKVTEKSGSGIVEGLALGITENTGLALSSAELMAAKTVNALNTSLDDTEVAAVTPVLDMSAIYAQIDGMDDDGEWQMVIKPVLDMSEINPGLKNLNAIVSAKAQTAADSAIQNGSANSVQTIWSPTFNQYNSSPKALSRTEIYRQTKNQFSALKGVMSR